MIKNYDEIIYNVNFNHQINITKKELYKKNGWLFVDLKDTTIEVFKYPVNDYFEPYTHLWNIKKKPFKDFINNEVDFSGEYPKEKNPPKIQFYKTTVASGVIKKDKPEEGKTYALTGTKNDKCIANGYSWSDSEVK